MGHLLLSDLRETKFNTPLHRFRCAEPMLTARFSAVHRFCVYLIVFSMVGATVFGYPSRSNLQTEMDHQDTVRPPSFSPDNFNALSDSATETYEYITATEVVTDLVEIEVLSTEPSGMTTTQSLGPNTSEEDESDVDERIQKQLLEKGCSLLNRTTYPQKKLRRIRGTNCGATFRMFSKSGEFLRIDGSYVSWPRDPERGTDVTIIQANGPGLVRIKVARSKRYLKMGDAGLLSAVTLTDQELNSNVGPTVWNERVAPGKGNAFNYFQDKGNGTKWFLRSGNSPVQAQNNESNNTKFYRSLCNG